MSVESELNAIRTSMSDSIVTYFGGGLQNQVGFEMPSGKMVHFDLLHHEEALWLQKFLRNWIVAWFPEVEDIEPF